MMTDRKDERSVPVTRPGGEDGGPSFVRRNAWRLGGTLAVMTIGGFLWRRRRQRKHLEVGPVSEQWLIEHEYERGQSGE
jgi:hypothetical protein